MNILSKLHKTATLYDHELPALPTQAPAPQGHALASYIDHTLLKPEATHEQIRILCDEAAEHRFASVCVNPVHVPQVARTLAGSPVAVCTVIGFPLGANLPEIKALEALAAIHGGAQEVDIVINVGALKSGAVGMVLNDLLAVIQVAHNAGALVKVILETALLTRLEKITACLLCKEAGAEFVKTSTGFSSGGATTEDVELMRRVVGSRMGVKASGGVRSFADCMAMIQAGANRIGTSSGVKIMQEALR